VLLIGLAVSRFCTVSFRSLEVLRAFGLTPSQTRYAAAAAPASAGMVGALLGGVAAVWASQWFPIGSAALSEPTPGIDVDVVVLVGVIVVALLLVVGLCTWSVRPGRRSLQDVPATGGAVVGAMTAAWPLRIGMGTRLALEGGPARSSTSGRSALVAAVLGVAGVVAALTFSAGITDATTGYERFGQTAELGAYFGSGSEDFVDSAAVLGTIAADPDVDGLNDAYNGVAGGERGPVSLYTHAPIGEPLDVVVLDGRMPETASEVALAPTTADNEGVAVGDTITLTGTAGVNELTVTGLAFIPTGPHNGYAEGGWILPEAYDHLFDGEFRFHFALISTAPGVDPQQVADRLQASDGVELSPAPIIPPVERDELVQLRTVPLLLAGFLAILGVGAIAHTLTSTARRRRHDFAMLRALGMRPRDTSLVIIVQAAVIALVSLSLGIPTGIVLGRLVWRTVALDTPVQLFIPAVWPLLIATTAAVFAIALLLAVWPSQRLASVRLGDELRYE